MTEIEGSVNRESIFQTLSLTEGITLIKDSINLIFYKLLTIHDLHFFWNHIAVVGIDVFSDCRSFEYH